MDKRVIKSPDIRRRHDRKFKQDLIELSLQPGASVSAIAQAHGINANLLFNWKRRHLGKRAVDVNCVLGATLLPVVVSADEREFEARRDTPLPSGPAPPCPPVRKAPGVIEIEIGAARVRLRGAIDEADVRGVLAALMSLTK